MTSTSTLASTSTSNPSSPFPSRCTSLRLPPSHSVVHVIDRNSGGYNNYSAAFSEVTAYDNRSNVSRTSRFIADPLPYQSRSASISPSPSPARIPAPAQSPPSPSPSSSSSSSAAAAPAPPPSLNSPARQLEALGNKFLNAISDTVKTPPTVRGLSRTQSLHARAKSLASFVPSLNSLSVEEHQGSSSLRSAAPHRPRSFGPLFTSSSLRHRPSSPYVDDTEEQEQQPQDYYPFIMDYKSTLSGGDRPRLQSQASDSPTVTSRSSIGASSFRKFGWFGSSKQQPIQVASVDAPLDHADLLQPAASLLLPHGNPDPQNPSSFTDLLQNAEALITRLQMAYAHQETALKTARQEREAATDEAEEADTRACHLKLQLDDMSKKAREQDRAMKAMADELASERLLRVQERQQRRIREENDPTPKRRPFRNSAASSNSTSSMASDSGFESDCYAETETDASTASRPMTPLYEQPRWEITPVKEMPRPLSRGSMQDRMCQVDVAVWTWMREEKGRLERRVKELETAVDGCLDLVSRS